MVGQHFDNLWLYSKAVTDKYDADNRIDHGISKDLVAEALKNFGVKLYTSNKSVEDLFTTFIGQTYQSGSEVISNYITGSLTGSNAPIQPTSYDNYQKEVQKRIYHNLPLLLKSKGTERGLRALINCLGISPNILQIKLYGGRNRNERPFYGDYRFYTSSLDKIRLDNTGSIVSGSTLSQYTSIIKRDDKYTDDLHPIEVGFSPTDNVDNYIISKSLSTGSLSNFNIDDYIGDPRNLQLDGYYTFGTSTVPSQSLSDLTNQIMSGSTAYNVQDYVRLIKFYDNTIFKMVKDFIPARAVADTGIIIKPHVLSRSKAKSVILSGSRPELSGSIDTAFISAGDTNSFRDIYAQTTGLPAPIADTRYTDNIQTPTGIQQRDSHEHYEVNYNGEVSASFLTVSKVDLNEDNIYKIPTYESHPYSVSFVSSSNIICLLNTNPNAPTLITDPNQSYSADAFFGFINENCVYSASQDGGVNWVNPVNFSTTFPIQGLGFTPGVTQSIKLRAFNKNVVAGTCVRDITVNYAPCTLTKSQIGNEIATITKWVSNAPFTDITTWFNTPANQILQYTASWTDQYGPQVEGLPVNGPTIGRSANGFRFDQATDTVVTIKAKDKALGSLCEVEIQATVTGCSLKRKTYSNSLSSTSLNDPNTAETKRGFGTDFSTYYNPAHIGITNPSDTGDDGVQTNVVVDESGIVYRWRRNFLGGGYRYPDPAYPTATDRFLPRYYGLQSYFRNYPGNGGSWGNVAQNPSLRYNIYIMVNPNGQTGPGPQLAVTGSVDNVEGYEIKSVALGIDPREDINDYIVMDGADVLAYDIAFENITWRNIAVDGEGATTYGILPTPNAQTPIYYKPIVLFTNNQNTYALNTQADTVSFSPKDRRALVRAYIIECYQEGNDLCRAQVVVYPNRTSNTNNAEGNGTYPQFTTKNILVDWPYNDVPNQVTQPQFAYPSLQNPVGGPWMSVKVRTYTTTPTANQGTAPNTPPD